MSVKQSFTQKFIERRASDFYGDWYGLVTATTLSDGNVQVVVGEGDKAITRTLVAPDQYMPATPNAFSVEGYLRHVDAQVKADIEAYTKAAGRAPKSKGEEVEYIMKVMGPLVIVALGCFLALVALFVYVSGVN